MKTVSIYLLILLSGLGLFTAAQIDLTQDKTNDLEITFTAITADSVNLKFRLLGV